MTKQTSHALEDKYNAEADAKKIAKNEAKKETQETSLENRIELTGEVPSLMDRPNGCEFHTRCPFSSKHCDDEFPPIHTFNNHQILTCHYPLN